MLKKNLKGYIFSETIVDWILCCCVTFRLLYYVIWWTKHLQYQNKYLSFSPKTHNTSKKEHNDLFCLQKVLRAFLVQQPYSNNANTGTSMIKNRLDKNYASIL